MRTLEDKRRIISLLAQFSQEAQLSQAISYTDLSREAQSVLCQILAITHDWPNLKNLDSEDPNHPAIDLGDSTARVAIQVTGDPTGGKIRDTVEKFVKHGLQADYDTLKVCVITKKQASYRVDVSDLLPQFSFDEDVFDLEDIWRTVQDDPARRRKLLQVLEAEFGDDGSWAKAVSAEDIADLEAVYVRPSNFEAALDKLRETGLVVLVGPPHIGKSTTAKALLLEVGARFDNARILKLTPANVLERAKDLFGEYVWLDDPLGAVHLDDPTLANSFQLLLDLAKRNKVVLATRQKVFEEAERETRIGERADPAFSIVRLHQEGSYDDLALTQVLAKHLNRRLAQPERFGVLLPETANYINQHASYIVPRLRFPHNLERLVSSADATISDISSLDRLIRDSKDISAVARRWFEALTFVEQVLVGLCALLPNLDRTDYFRIKKELALLDINEAILVLRSGGFLALSPGLHFAHPSYHEGVLMSLRQAFLSDAEHIIRRAIAAVAPRTFDEVVPFLLACKQLNPKRHFSPATRPAHFLPATEYFQRYIETYNGIIDNDFPRLRQGFEPGLDAPARVHLYRTPGVDDSASIVWSLAPTSPAGPFLTESTDSPYSSGSTHRTSLEEELEAEFPQLSLVQHFGANLDSIPEVDALDHVWSQLRNVERMGIDCGPTWDLVTLFQGLHSIAFPVHLITDEAPLTSQWIRDFTQPYVSFFTTGEMVGKLEVSKMTLYFREGVMNDLDIEWACQVVDTFARRGLHITSDVLLGPDIVSEGHSSHWNTTRDSDRYSDAQLCSAVETGFATTYRARYEMLTQLFPTFASRMDFVTMFPLEIFCFVEIDRERYHHGPDISYAIRAWTQGMQGADVTVRAKLLISNATSVEKEEFRRAKQETCDGRQSDLVRMGSLRFESLVNHRFWLKSVSSKLWSELESFMISEERKLYGGG